MEEIIAGNVEQLCENFKGKDVYLTKDERL